MPHAHTFMRKIIRYFGIEAEFSSTGIGYIFFETDIKMELSQLKNVMFMVIYFL